MFGGVGLRDMMCGMHVHVQLPEQRQALRRNARHDPVSAAVHRAVGVLAVLESHKSGLKGYRLAAYRELPRTGLPELFETEQQYRDYVDALKTSGVIPDESYIWWAMRPSLRHPTLELRAPDTCTLIEDGVAIASLYRALARYLHQRPELSQRVTRRSRDRGREQVARAALRHRLHLRFQGRSGSDRGAAVAFDRSDRGRRRSARLRRRSGALPHHRQRGSSADFQLRAFEESGENIFGSLALDCGRDRASRPKRTPAAA